MPFGAVQIVVIVIASYSAYSWKNKSIILGLLVLPVTCGLAMLYGESPHEPCPLSDE